MNCSEFQQRLDEALDAHGPTDEESVLLREHLAQCERADCAERWADVQMLSQALEPWRRSLPQVDLVDRVVRELRASGTRPAETPSPPLLLQARYGMVRVPADAGRTTASGSQPAGHGTWRIVATVATALIMVCWLTLNPPGDSPVASQERRLPVATTIEVAQSPPQTGEASRLSPEFVASYAAMPLSASEFVTDAVVLVVPADLSDPDEEPSRAARWADRLEKQWEPIGKELGSAFEVLLKAVPKSPATST